MVIPACEILVKASLPRIMLYTSSDEELNELRETLHRFATQIMLETACVPLRRFIVHTKNLCKKTMQQIVPRNDFNCSFPTNGSQLYASVGLMFDVAGVSQLLHCRGHTRLTYTESLAQLRDSDVPAGLLVENDDCLQVVLNT